MYGFTLIDKGGEILASREPKMLFHFRKSVDPATGTAVSSKKPKPIDQMSAADIASELAEELLSAITSLITTPNGDQLDPDAVIEAASKTALAAMRRRHGATSDRSDDSGSDASLNPSAAQKPAEVAGSGSIAQSALPADIRKALGDVLGRQAVIDRGGVDSRLVFDLAKGRAAIPGASSSLLEGDSIEMPTPIAKRAVNLNERIDNVDSLIDRIAKRERAPLEFSAVFGGGSDSPLSSYVPIEQPDFASDLAKRIAARERAGVAFEKLLR